MAVAFGPTSCSSGLVPKSNSYRACRSGSCTGPKAQYSFVPKHSHHGGKNTALWAKKTEIPNENENQNLVRVQGSMVKYVFSCFFLGCCQRFASETIDVSVVVRKLACRHRRARQQWGAVGRRQQ